MIKEREYLETEHLLVAVKCEDSDESYGEGCISLMNIFSDKPQRFKCEISHRGAHIGILSGGVHIVGAIGEGRMKKLLTDDDDMGTARGDKMGALHRGKEREGLGTGGRIAEEQISLVLRALKKLFLPFAIFLLRFGNFYNRCRAYLHVVISCHVRVRRCQQCCGCCCPCHCDAVKGVDAGRRERSFGRRGSPSP